MRHKSKSYCKTFLIKLIILLLFVFPGLTNASTPKNELKRRRSAYQAMAEAKLEQNILVAGEDTNLQKLAHATLELDQSKINAWYDIMQAKFRLIEQEDFTYEAKNILRRAVLYKSKDPISISDEVKTISSSTTSSTNIARSNREESKIKTDESDSVDASDNIEINGIVYSEDKPLAIVDGEIIHEGDTVKGNKVLRIYKNGIEFENNGKNFLQKVGYPRKIEYEYQDTSSLKEVSTPIGISYDENVKTVEEHERDYDLADYKSIECFKENIPLQKKRKKYSGTCADIGNYKFYNATCSNGNYFTGTSNEIGQFEFHNFQRSDGISIYGSSTKIGNQDFHQFSLSDGTSINGTTTKIGNFSFHNFATIDGQNINGTSNRLGNFTVYNFYDSEGHSTSGTSVEFGGQTYRNYDW